MTTKDKRYPALSDTDLMPFGKYKGEPLQDVPASYLAWLWRDGVYEYSRSGPLPDNAAHGQPGLAERIALANYIWNAKDAIAQEIGETL